jgi:hypothetical protein
MIGKAIYNILTNDADVSAIIGTRVYPVVLPMGIDHPALVYRISDVQDVGTKQAIVQKNYNVEVTVGNIDYDTLGDIADKVRAALSRKTGTYSGIQIQRSNCVANGNEGFDIDNQLYIRVLKFEITQKL